MADPLQDERATALMSTDTALLTRIVGEYDDAARLASFTARGLRAASEETVWEGDAADRFTEAIGAMPRRLDAVLNRLYAVRVALSDYEHEVAGLQTEWRRACAAGGDTRDGQAILARFDAARTELCGLVDRASRHAITQDSFPGARRGVRRRDRAVAPIPVPPPVRERLAHMNEYVRSVMGTDYVSGGAHSSFDPNGGLDRSGFVSGVLHAGGCLGAPPTTATPPGEAGIVPGAGRYVTIYDRTGVPLADEHVIIDIAGQFYEEGGSASGGAPDVHRFTPSPEYLRSFNQILHPVGL